MSTTIAATTANYGKTSIIVYEAGGKVKEEKGWWVNIATEGSYNFLTRQGLDELIAALVLIRNGEPAEQPTNHFLIMENAVVNARLPIADDTYELLLKIRNNERWGDDDNYGDRWPNVEDLVEAPKGITFQPNDDNFEWDVV